MRQILTCSTFHAKTVVKINHLDQIWYFFWFKKRKKDSYISDWDSIFSFPSLNILFLYLFSWAVSQPPSHTWIVGLSNLFPHKHIYFTVCAHLFTSSNCSVGILQRFEKHAHILIRELKKGIHFFQGNI